ncbi:hypothetical protein HAX54_045429, partial [Datura stramonium]|nr:hypothetical protein [Datura stramonium]
ILILTQLVRVADPNAPLSLHVVQLGETSSVQLSQGFTLSFFAIKYILYNQDCTTIKASTTIPHSWLGLDSLILTLTSISFLILVFYSSEVVKDDEDNTNSTNG